MKYVFAITVCLFAIFMFYFAGVIVFGWKHGGGAIPNAIECDHDNPWTYFH